MRVDKIYFQFFSFFSFFLEKIFKSIRTSFIGVVVRYFFFFLSFFFIVSFNFNFIHLIRD